MNTRNLALLASAGLLCGCPSEDETPDPNDSIGVTSDGDADTGEPDDDSDPSADDADDSADDGDDSADDGDSGLNPPIYDVHGVGGGYCEEREAGIYCDDNVAIECDDSHNTVFEEECIPAFCEPNVGCLPCLEGQFDCHGPHVVRCDTSVQPHVWETIETCDPAAMEGLRHRQRDVRRPVAHRRHRPHRRVLPVRRLPEPRWLQRRLRRRRRRPAEQPAVRHQLQQRRGRLRGRGPGLGRRWHRRPQPAPGQPRRPGSRRAARPDLPGVDLDRRHRLDLRHRAVRPAGPYLHRWHADHRDDVRQRRHHGDHHRARLGEPVLADRLRTM